MKSIQSQIVLALGTLAAGASYAPYALAQANVSASNELEEVVVTASKREVNLQKVPESIQVKSGEDLRETGKKRIDEIMQGTVGIQAQDSQVGVTFFVRGVDSSAGMGGVVAVPILIDGVAQSRSESVRGGTLDLARAEIMRGPQSTSLGANALAGAISLVSNQPVFQYTASGSVEVGDYSKRALEGVLNVPLSDRTAIRVAYSLDKRDGYISAGAGDSDITNVRAKFRWQPNDNLDTVFTTSQQHIGGNGVQSGVLLSQGYWHAVTPAVAGLPATATTSATGILGLSSSGCGTSLPNITLMGCPAYYYTDGTGPTFRQRANAWNDGYPPNSFPNGPFRDTVITQVSEQIDWTTGIGVLTVLPSVQFAHFLSKEPPRGGSYMKQDERETTPTLDVHLNSNTSGKLTWQVGGYYSRDNLYNSYFGNAAYPGATGGPPSSCAQTYTQTCFDWQDTPQVVRTNVSGYANGEFSIIDPLRVVGGVRYSKDKAQGTIDASVNGSDAGPDPVLQAAAASYSGSADWSKTTYRVGFEYDVVPGTMLYTTYSTGYTPGAFSLSAPGMGPGSTTANPATTLKQISLGWKSQFLNNRLQVNGDFFRTSFYNRQVEGTINSYVGGATTSNCVIPFPPPPGSLAVGQGGGGYCLTVNQNAAYEPELRSTGFDLDSTWLITGNDRLSLTYEYLKSQYQAVPLLTNGGDYSPTGVVAVAAGNNPPIAISLANATILSQGLTSNLQAFVGVQLQNAPLNSATLDYQHSFRLASGATLTPRVAAVYKTKYWSFGGTPGANVSQILADSNNPNDLAWQQAYSKWDVFLNWESADGKFDVNAYVKNVQDKVVLANYGGQYVSLEAPRTSGVVFSLRL